MKDGNEYITKFDEMMSNKGNDFYTFNSINKFKIIDDESSHCFKSELLGANLYHWINIFILFPFFKKL